MTYLRLLFLNATVPAKITEEAKSISVTQGDPATLEVHFSGTKPLKIKWLKASKDLSLGQRYKVQTTDNSSVLKINKTDKTDGGEFTFEVSNDVGQSSCEATLTILGQYPPQHIPPQRPTSRAVSDSISFPVRSNNSTIFYKKTEADRRYQGLLCPFRMPRVRLLTHYCSVVQRRHRGPNCRQAQVHVL